MLPGIDENGLLKDPQRWNESVARDGLGELTDDHWKIIQGLREH